MRPPFCWLCHQEPLPWHGDYLNGSVIPLHAHGPNRLDRDETPILQLGLDFIILWVPPFLFENNFIAFSGIPGRSI
jgi:hypothetical protein